MIDKQILADITTIYNALRKTHSTSGRTFSKVRVYSPQFTEKLRTIYKSTGALPIIFYNDSGFIKIDSPSKHKKLILLSHSLDAKFIINDELEELWIFSDKNHIYLNINVKQFKKINIIISGRTIKELAEPFTITIMHDGVVEQLNAFQDNGEAATINLKILPGTDKLGATRFTEINATIHTLELIGQKFIYQGKRPLHANIITVEDKNPYREKITDESFQFATATESKISAKALTVNANLLAHTSAIINSNDKIIVRGINYPALLFHEKFKNLEITNRKFHFELIQNILSKDSGRISREVICCYYALIEYLINIKDEKLLEIYRNSIIKHLETKYANKTTTKIAQAKTFLLAIIDRDVDKIEREIKDIELGISPYSYDSYYASNLIRLLSSVTKKVTTPEIAHQQKLKGE